MPMNEEVSPAERLRALAEFLTRGLDRLLKSSDSRAQILCEDFDDEVRIEEMRDPVRIAPLIDYISPEI